MSTPLRNIISSLLCILFLSSLCFAAPNQRIETTIFGDVVIDDPVVADLLDAPVMERLRHIDQSGTPRYFTEHIPSFTRYDHSVGVYALLKKVQRPLNEQLAGLLHDASHTVFSHTGDWAVNRGEDKDSYQDDIHGWYLKQMKVDEILEPYHIQLKEVHHKNNNQVALEQNLPDMCADRIEYNLHTGLIFGMITKAEVAKIADDLRFENNKWFFTDPSLAKKFAQLSIYFTQYFWGSSYNQSINYWSGELMKRAFEIGLVTKDDFHFGKDEDILSRLRSSDDPIIKDYLNKCANYQGNYEVVDRAPYHMETKPKFRGIDPLVRVKGKLVRLSSIDPDYKHQYERVQSLVNKGIKIRFM
jgi:HD superfamily phosphohydrolase